MADIPSLDLPIPPSSSTPPPPSKPSTPPSKEPSLTTLLTWTPLYLTRKTDSHITTLSRILSTPAGTDTLLLLLGYSTLLTSTILTTISTIRLRLLSKLLIEKAISLPENTVILIEGHIPTSRTLLIATRLRALSGLISDFRIFARLWGLLGIWRWGKGVWSSSAADGEKEEKEDQVEKRLVKAQVLVNFAFQILENGAYLSSKGVLGWSSEKQNKAWLWSSRFWAAHVGLEFLRLGRVYAIRKGGSEEERRRDGPMGDVWTGRKEGEWLRGWRREVLVNAAWAPLTLHWSTEGGLIGDFWVGVFGSVAGVVGTRKAWRAAVEAGF